jgi:serine protease AprX
MKGMMLRWTQIMQESKEVYGMKNWKAAVVALFLIGIMAGMTAAAPVKPHVNSEPMQKNYGLLTPGLFKKVQRMDWDQEISTVIMFDNPQDQEKALRILKLMGAEIKYNYKVIPAVAAKIKVRDLLMIAGMIDTGFFVNSRYQE